MIINLQDLTKKELQLYAYLKSHQSQVVYMSIRDIAKENNISTATVMRLVHKLGYSSFSDYKYSLKKKDHLDEANTSNEIIQCLKRLDEDYYREQIEEIALLMRQMNVIIFHGIGSSGPIAGYGERKFSEAGMFAFSSNDPFFMNTKKIRKRADVFLSVSGDTPEMLELATAVPDHLDQDSFSLAITANLEAPLSALCDYTIAYPLPIRKHNMIVESSQIITVAIVERLASLIKSNDM